MQRMDFFNLASTKRVKIPLPKKTFYHKFHPKILWKLVSRMLCRPARDDFLVVGYGETDTETLLDQDQNMLPNHWNKPNKTTTPKSSYHKQKVNLWAMWCLKMDWNQIQIKSLPSRTCQSQYLSLKYLPWLAVNYRSKFLPELSDGSAKLRGLKTDQSKFTRATQHEEAFTTIQWLVTKHQC